MLNADVLIKVSRFIKRKKRLILIDNIIESIKYLEKTVIIILLPML